MNTDLTTLWIIIAVVGAGTLALRASFLMWGDRIPRPAWLDRALRQVPPAVLAVLVTANLVIRDNRIDLSPANHRLLAGLIAALVAWRTRSLLWTIVAGMAALWLLNQLT